MVKSPVLFSMFWLSVFLFSGTSTFSQSFQWVKQLGNEEWDEVIDIETDENDNVYCIGTFEGTVDFDPGPEIYNLTSSEGSQNAFLTKFDAAGSFQWAKLLAGEGWVEVNDLHLDDLGNIYITGSFLGTIDFDPSDSTFELVSGGSIHAFICKLDTAGNLDWATNTGGSLAVNSFAVTTDSEGNVYSTGYFDGTADLDPGDGTFQMTVMGYSDAFVRKLDSSGNFIWVKQLGGSQGSVGHSIGVDSNGNVYTTGTFATTVDFDPGEDTFILESEDEQSMYLSKLDSSGSFQWAKNMGGDVGYSLIVDQSDDIYVTGYYGWDDIFINKLNPVGNLLWEKQIGAFVCYSLEVDEQGNIYTIGQFYETGDFNPGPDVYELTAIGSSDSYINMLDSSGNFMWVKQIGGTDEVLSRSLAMDSNGALLTAGTFNGTADFDPGPATSELTSSGSYDIFLQKLEPSGVSVSENSFSKDVKVYPNPTDGKVTVEFTEMQAELDIIVTNSVGQIVKTESMKRGTRTEFQIKGASGVYFLEILNQDKQNAIFRVLKN